MRKNFSDIKIKYILTSSLFYPSINYNDLILKGVNYFNLLRVPLTSNNSTLILITNEYETQKKIKQNLLLYVL